MPPTTGTGQAPSASQYEALLAKIRAGNNTRARMQTAFHGLQNQLQTQLAGGATIADIEAWGNMALSSVAINGYCDAIETGGTT